MKIQTSKAILLIEKSETKNGCISVHSNSQEELSRFFNAPEIIITKDFEFPYMVYVCKQEFANSMILMVKEIDYSDFSEFSLQMA